MNRLTLYFNAQKCSEDFCNRIRQVADDLLEEYYAEIYNKLNTTRAKADVQKLSYEEHNMLIREVIGKANAIMDSYGTGSQMDTSNPALSEYMNSELWNSERTGLEIVGRDKGIYKNIYGSTDYSSGNMAGKNVEYSSGNPKGKVTPITPSFAFQDAEKWFIKGNRIDTVLNTVIKNFFADMSKYFEMR